MRVNSLQYVGRPPASHRRDLLISLARGAPIDVPVLIVAPHPDDETIGAGGALGNMAESHVVCVSDGAPEDPKLWPRQFPCRFDYALLRQRELEQALALVGLDTRRIHQLGAIDQKCVFEIPRLVKALLGLLREVRPELVLVTPYEGGHPDHDAAALVTRAAASLLEYEQGISMELIEMASYHRGDHGLESGCFLGSDSGHEYLLDAAARERKQRMLSQHASQASVLSAFGLSSERFRYAPTYDFTQPPCAGAALYESFGWPITRAEWCHLASAALQELGLNSAGRVERRSQR